MEGAYLQHLFLQDVSDINRDYILVVPITLSPVRHLKGQRKKIGQGVGGVSARKRKNTGQEYWPLLRKKKHHRVAGDEKLALERERNLADVGNKPDHEVLLLTLHPPDLVTKA